MQFHLTEMIRMTFSIKNADKYPNNSLEYLTEMV